MDGAFRTFKSSFEQSCGLKYLSDDCPKLSCYAECKRLIKRRSERSEFSMHIEGLSFAGLSSEFSLRPCLKMSLTLNT